MLYRADGYTVNCTYFLASKFSVLRSSVPALLPGTRMANPFIVRDLGRQVDILTLALVAKVMDIW